MIKSLKNVRQGNNRIYFKKRNTLFVYRENGLGWGRKAGRETPSEANMEVEER